MVREGDAFGLTAMRRSNGNCVVALPPYLRDKVWANGMGSVQAAISEVAQSDALPKKRVIFDFTKCCWIDPLPLMSLLLEIANARNLGITVEVRLPEPDGGPKPTEVGPYQGSPNRLLWFLNEEGFLDCLDSLADDGLVYLPKAGREAYRTLRVTPSYEDARCIPVTLFDVPVESDDGTFAQDSVERLLRGVDTKLDAKVAPQTRERLTYKLRVVLQEALHNAQEHAYESGTSPCLLAIYVRYRVGGIGLDSGGRKVFDKHAQEERAQCPGLDPEWLATRPGCLEVFVLDRGMGMVKSFELGKRPLTETYKFNQVMKETFLDGRSRKSERHTAYGGLHLLHNLLSDTTDFIRGLEEGTWFASAAPIIRVGKQTHTLTANQVRMRGLAMHFRLGWRAETDYGDKWATFSQGKDSEVWPELMLHEDESASSFAWFEQQTVIDERFGDENVTSNKSGWILWLVRQHRMKADILAYLERIVAPLAPEQATLIIADIPSYEAETYAAALAEYRTGHENPWPRKFAHIILSTNRWRFAALDYETKSTRHGFSKLRENFSKWKGASPKIDPKPKNFRLAIVRWLKWHDSNLLWKEISKRGSMFIPENVTWGTGEDGQNRIISGYLDFPRTASNPLCADIYRASLARVLGVLPPNQVRMCPLDLLTMTVLRDIHTTEIYEPASTLPPTQLAVGSILVSGATLDASVAQGLDLHFFVHRSSPLRGTKNSLLFWLPPVEIKAGAPRLARIGKTATIAPEGWKSFEVPRFDANKELIGGRGPRETYEDWQGSNPVIVKAGHWSYQGHHDFLTINIAGAVEAAFLEKNDLARFLVQRILPFIGINSEHLKENCRRLLDPDQPESCNQLLPAEYGLLVYRSHPSTESVIRRLLETLTKEGRELASQRIFPILPVRMRWSGSTLLIPPLVRQEIRAAINPKGQPRAVLVFDDAAITGRTLHDLRAALSTIGAREVTTMVIANRLRQPSDGDGSMRLQYYWRLDVPVIGRDGNCPLCHAIDLAKEFIGALASEDAKNEVKLWMQEWENVSAIDNWNRGLRPLPLSRPEMSKKYCCRLPEDPSSGAREYLTLVDVIRSTGLVINVSELHAMTGRDDYFLKKIGDHHEPEVRVELAASQLLLFGNEFDVDVRISLVQVLIRELARLNKGSAHAKLAGLATVLGLSMLNGDAKSQAVKAVGDAAWTTRHNYSSRVLLAYLAKSELLDKQTESYRIGIRLLSTAQLSLASRLSALFLETLSPLGNPHSEAIPSLLEQLKGSGQLNSESVQNALDSLGHLEDLILGLDRSLVRKDARSIDETSMNDWKSYSGYAMELLRQWRQAQESVGLGNVSVALENYLAAVKIVASAYFHQIHSAPDYYRNRTFETVVLRKIISDVDWTKASEGKSSSAGDPIENYRRVIQLSSAGDLDFDCNAGEIWITWYHGIPGVLLDLMRNAVYAAEQIADPWDPASEELADMWIRVDYRKKCVELTLANASGIDVNCLGADLKSHRWFQIVEIGGTVSTMSIKRNVVALRVSIPYAAYLST
ncbi:MAG: hypothetical protein CVU32_00175 [Betaproteobacteria bacterium HGW-Betaproteobacteria-5]|nr:MAG: hypothetical protein CVU32_00175 [Betaproteobacteria bacterium HGW-Betaproteobacteria-5]